MIGRRTTPAATAPAEASVKKEWGPFPATVVRIHDGDTIYVDLQLRKVRMSQAHPDVDLGFNVHERPDGVYLADQSIRLLGCNAPELATPEGKAALAFLETVLKPGDRVHVTSTGWDKYGGRIDATVQISDGRDLTAVMIAANQAAPWDGQGGKPLPQAA